MNPAVRFVNQDEASIIDRQSEGFQTTELTESQRISIAIFIAEISDEIKVIEKKYPEVNLDRLKRKVVHLCRY